MVAHRQAESGELAVLVHETASPTESSAEATDDFDGDGDGERKSP